jgi:polar amino acid transport system substrate-binding protein
MMSRLAAVTALSLSLLLAACGTPVALPGAASAGASTSVQSSTLPAVQADAALTAKLPQRVRDSKKILIGVDATYKPNEYLDADSKTSHRHERRALRRRGCSSGRKTEWQPSAFDQIIIGVQAKRVRRRRVVVHRSTPTAKRPSRWSPTFPAGSLWAVARATEEGRRHQPLRHDDHLPDRHGAGRDEIKVTDEKCRRQERSEAPVPGPG